MPRIRAGRRCRSSRARRHGTIFSNGLSRRFERQGESRGILFHYTLALEFHDSKLDRILIDAKQPMTDAVESCIIEGFKKTFHPESAPPERGVVPIEVRFVAVMSPR